MRCSRDGMRLSAAVFTLALWPCAVLLAQDYEIHLHRPQAVGQKYHLSASGRSAQTKLVRDGDKILENDATKFSVECECVVTVLAVDGNGKPSKLFLEIEKLSRTDDAGPKELLSKGSPVTLAMKEGGEVAEMNGHRLAVPTQEALMVVLPLYPNGPTDDALYGTTQRKKPGDHWDVNADVVVNDLRRRNATARKEDVTGTVSFDKLLREGNTECMQISGNMDCAHYVPEVPHGVTVEKGFLKVEFSEIVPVAASAPVIQMTQSANIGYTMRGRLDPTGDEITIDVGGILNNYARMSAVAETTESPR